MPCKLISFNKLASVVALVATATLLQAQGGRLLFEAYGAGFSRAGGYGTSIANVGDVNGDGTVDIAVGDPSFFWSSGPSNRRGTVEFLSGLDGSPIRSVAVPSGAQEMGLLVAALSDVNGDGVRDVLAGSRNEVFVFSGMDGLELRRLQVSAQALTEVGDLDGDLVPDFMVVDQSGVATTYSGQTGVPVGATLANVTDAATIPALGMLNRVLVQAGTVRYFTGPSTNSWSQPGYRSVADAGDLDGDGRNEVIAVTSNGAAAVVLTGLAGAVLRTVPGGTVAIGGVDLSGDGVPDLAVGDPTGVAQGLVRAYSGADGTLLFAHEGQEDGEGMGWDLAMASGIGSGMRAAVLVSSFARYDGSLEAGAVLALAQAAPGEVDGSFRGFGSPCNLLFTELRPTRGLPTIGQTYFYRFDNSTMPMGFQFTMFGLSNTMSSNGIPLPFTLPVSGCPLYVSPDAIVVSGFNVFGSLAIPNDPSFVGFVLHIQGIDVPRFRVSNGGTLTIGN